MKGFGKVLARTPFAVTSKIGMSKRSNDTEFEEFHRHFTQLEQAAEKLIKDTKAFCQAVTDLFEASSGYANHMSAILSPIAGEYDLIGKHPDSAHSIRSVTMYEQAMIDMKEVISPELQLIESRILSPAMELQSVMKLIRKTITKRGHKLTDYDRFNNSLTKLRDKKDKSLSDEKNLFKLEQDFELATNEYNYINTALKQDLPRFMTLATQYVDPLFNSLYYMQLNVYYLLLEKMHSFADENKWDISNVPGSQIAQEYEDKRTDAWSQIENLSIIKRIVSVSRLVQVSRSQNGGTLSRSNTTATTSSGSSSLKPGPPPSRSTSVYKKAPPPPPPLNTYTAPLNSHPAPPPPYTSSPTTTSASLTSATRRPAPPPPVKPKPRAPPPIKYVVALYDFEAQAEGDLSFQTGDKIELIERTKSSEDWWTGKVNGVRGVFPGNYVQES